MIKTKTMQKPSVKYQYLTAFVVNMFTVGFGVLEGWPSPTILLLTSDETPLSSGKITMETASWFASLLAIGGLVGNIFFGYITNRFGRKLPLIIIAVPMILCWLLIWFAQNDYYLHAARFLGGFIGSGGYIMIPLFLSEIANDSVRGTLVSTLVLTENAGILLAYIIGNYFDFYAMPKFAIIVTIIFAISLCFLPESPLFLIKKNKQIKAESSIRFYKNMGDTDKERKVLEIEVNSLKNILGDNQPENSNTNSMGWFDVTTGIARKAIIIGVALIILNVCSGSTAMTAYTANIFKEAGSSLNPNSSAIAVGIIQLFGTFLSTHLVDRAGRKLLLVVSSIGTALGLIVLGAYMMVKSWDFNVEDFNWIPVVSFSWVFFISSLGVQSLPLTVISEIMPENIKDAAVSFCMTLLWIFTFLNVKYLPFLTDLLGFHGSMYMFACVCLSSAVFIILYLPETKGKSHEEIMKSLQ